MNESNDFQHQIEIELNKLKQYQTIFREPIIDLPPCDYLTPEGTTTQYFPNYISQKLNDFWEILNTPTFSSLNREINYADI